MTISLTGEPRSTQHCYKHTCRGQFASVYMSSECKTLKEDYQWQAKSQYHGSPITGPVTVKINLFHGTKRRSDIDNFNKLILDSLVGIVFNDDSQIQELLVIKNYVKSQPRVELEIHAM